MISGGLLRAFAVGAGGFIGAVARYLTGVGILRAFAPAFPWATFVVNATGCFAIGFLAVLADERLAIGPEARLFWIVGVLGGFTTFSAFGYETVALARGGQEGLAVANAVGQVIVGVIAVWGGAWIARSIT